MREVQGISSHRYTGTRRALVEQCGTDLTLDLCGYASISLTVAEARHLARSLNRLANRVEAANPPPTE